MLAAKTLAATAWDLFHEPATLAAARRELDAIDRKAYVPMIEQGQQPPLDYRNPPKTE